MPSQSRAVNPRNGPLNARNVTMLPWLFAVQHALIEAAAHPECRDVPFGWDCGRL